MSGALACLQALAEGLHSRLHFYQDPVFYCPRQGKTFFIYYQIGILKFEAVSAHRLDSRPVNAHASCSEGLEFKFQTGQILHSVANGSPPL